MSEEILNDLNDQIKDLKESLGVEMEEPAVAAVEPEKVPEEIKEPEVVEQELQVPEAQKEREYTDEEKEALAQGWNPGGVKSAGEFLRAGELISQLKEVRGENKHIRETLDHIVNIHQTQKKAAYEQGIRDAEIKRLQAVQDGDLQAFEQYDNQLKELNKIQAQEVYNAEVSKQQIITKQVLDEFLEKNRSWYDESNLDNVPLVAFANAYENQIVQQVPDHRKRLEIVEMEVKKRFPNHPAFINVNREKPATVIAKGDEISPTDVAFKSLTRQQRQLYEYAKKMDPKFKIEDYLAEIKKK